MAGKPAGWSDAPGIAIIAFANANWNGTGERVSLHLRHRDSVMLRILAFLGLCFPSMVFGAAQPEDELPKPRYRFQPDDPQWLRQAVQFHGHLGPWAAAGVRAGMAGLKAVDAKGHFDIDVQAFGPLAKPPRSCFLDGLQVGTGATWGKRNISFTEAEKLSVRITNTRTGKIAQLHPTAKLMELLTSFKPKDVSEEADDHDDDDDDHEDPLEVIARKIASMPQNELFVIEVASGRK